MYLDIFKEKSVEENFKSLQAYVIILSLVIVFAIIISEFSSGIYLGTLKAIIMMTGFWLMCSSFQHRLQTIAYPKRIFIFLLLASIQWFVIFMYFTKKY